MGSGLFGAASLILDDVVMKALEEAEKSAIRHYRHEELLMRIQMWCIGVTYLVGIGYILVYNLIDKFKHKKVQ